MTSFSILMLWLHFCGSPLDFSSTQQILSCLNNHNYWYKLKMKKKKLNFLIVSNEKINSLTMGNNWFGTIYNFLASTPNIRLLKDKLLTKIFTTAFQEIKLNPVRINTSFISKCFTIIYFTSLSICATCNSSTTM